MRSIRSIGYMVHNVTSLQDLLEMMRYENMRLTKNNIKPYPFSDLMARDMGLVGHKVPHNGVSIVLVKDQDKNWSPTLLRWESFQMKIERSTKWNTAPEL